MSKTTSTTAGALRVVADMLEQHADLPAPCVWAFTSGHVNVQWQLMHDDESADSQRAAARLIIRAIGGKWDKAGQGDTFTFKRRLADHDVTLEVLADREQVCERVVTGTTTVTIPAVKARPARTETVEVVEWNCEPVLSEASA